MSGLNETFGQSDGVRLNDEDATVALLERAVTGLSDVVSELTRLRRTTRPGSFAYESVKKLAGELTKMGCDIISGGGPVIMQAANEGAG